MAAGPVVLYNRFAKYLGDGTLDLDLAGTTLTAALVSSTSNFATATLNIYSELTNELTSANGYTAGGQALTAVTYTQSTAKAILTAAAPQWLASGAGITARAVVLYCNATLNSIVKPLVGYALLDTTAGGTDVTATAGQPFIVTWDATLGIVTVGPGTLS